MNDDQVKRVAGQAVAEVHYLSGDFEILGRGTCVLCAVTGEKIDIDQLRYWDAGLQEAYATAEIAARRHAEKYGKAG
jgi:hypothetical protein